MHKVKEYVLVFLIALLSIWGGIKIVELIELKNQKNHLMEWKNSVDEFVKEVKTCSVLCFKSGEKIFSKNVELEKSIERISRKFNIKKTLIKRNSSNEIEEIKILTGQEKRIYQFIEGLFFELPGISQFKSIKIFPVDDKNLAAVIQLKIFKFNECSDLIFINPSARSYDPGSINLFGMDKANLHKLFCTISNSQAYIDDSWFQKGDSIDNYRVVDIDQNSIKVQEDNGKITLINLGSSW
ncbi:MAG: hypothetical protein LBQ08_02200 [Holosporaceae bacterium]|jgi:hypothetical protein|nr:hypothetical protein [Holosporaceae bacterium]